MRSLWGVSCLLGIGLVLYAAISPAQAPGGRDIRTRLVVLGVDHSVQLVSERDQPGLLAAFIERVGPDAICVERAPEQFSRDDQYEFTYEIQGVVVPYARAHGIALCPIDWIMPHEDEMLGYGIDISTPPEVRGAEGFQGFLAFRQPEKLQRTLFAADDRASLKEVEDWIRTPAQPASRELPRRMYLYRTFLQARRIAAVAHQRPEQTVLVVVGEWHKHDIEGTLADDPALRIVQPTSFGMPSAQEVARSTTREQRIAVTSFNLLGTQAATGNVNWDWVERELAVLETERNDAEARLLRTRFEQLKGRMDAAAAAMRYRDIAAAADARRHFTWDGVQDRGRVDSYFDPFGNLRIDQRARLEQARSLYRLGEREAADALLATLRGEVTQRKARQLDAYWQRELAGDRPPAME
jgi:hypothetical protein